MSQILVIDVGNSRLKWALRGSNGWTARGAVANQEIGTLAVRDWQNLERPVRAVGVNVAGEAARVRVEGQLARWRLPIEWLAASVQAGGVTNHYEVPAQLGADRWASLVAARRRAVAANEAAPRPCIVVNTGTAVTIDALDADGAFRGGLILPGVRLMLRALADNTAALRTAPGEFRDFPTTTADAIYSGAVQAICGAIGQMRERLRGGGGEITCYLAGGALQDVAPRVAAPVEVVDNLVLEGVLVLALLPRPPAGG
ncbi:MAG TPA: type III pantothenate kinase [Casimicrobiaceae bacterium]|nr:type III pantothenate kinase [Casimicrobiaceae bacterium]